jgi:hypothetical protein
MSQKKDSRKDGKKETIFVDTDTGNFMIKERIIEPLSKNIIETLKLWAEKELNATVEELLQNEESLSNFIMCTVVMCEKLSIPVEIIEEALNKVFQSFDKTAIIKLKSVEKPAA